MWCNDVFKAYFISNFVLVILSIKGHIPRSDFNMIQDYSITICTDMCISEVIITAASEDEAMMLAELNWREGCYPCILGTEIVYIILTGAAE